MDCVGPLEGMRELTVLFASRTIPYSALSSKIRSNLLPFYFSWDTAIKAIKSVSTNAINSLRLDFNQLCKKSYKHGMIAIIYHFESHPAVFLDVVMLNV